MVKRMAAIRKQSKPKKKQIRTEEHSGERVLGIFTKTANKLNKDNSFVVFNGDLSPVYNKGNAKGIPVTMVEDFDIQPSQVAIKSVQESPIKKWLREERKVFND